MHAIPKDDVQDLIGLIRSMLELRHDPPESELQRLAQRYASTVQQINSILKVCLDLVERGLKSEALMRADESNLLEVVSILDFPEQQIWDEYLTQFGLPRPPAVDQFASRQINACYAPARRLEPLYRQNRRHALANSSLRVRLAVMRRIHKMESGSAKEVAGRQVELFEGERLKNVRTELAEATESSDHRRLQLLCAELTGNEWLQVPDTGLVRSAQRALKLETARRARLRMQTLAGQLQNAWSAHDVNAGRHVRRLWDDCQQHALLADSDSLFRETEAAFAWLRGIDEEEALQQACNDLVNQLHQALDQRQPRERLELLEHALESFDNGMPVALMNRLQTRYDELDVEARRKHVRRLVLMATGVVSVALLLTYLVRVRDAHETVAGHVTALENLLESGDVQSAVDYATTLQAEQPLMLQQPQIKVLLLGVRQAAEDEAARAAAFQTGVQSIREQLTAAASLRDADHLNEQLQALPSRTATEIQEAESLLADVEQQRRRIQSENDQSFSATMLQRAEELDQYENAGRMDVGRLTELRTVFTELAGTPDVSAELISGSAGPTALADRCQALILDLNMQEKREQLLVQISSGVGSYSRFRTALDTYAKEFPTDPLSLRFDALLRNEADIWPQVDVQNKFVLDHAGDCTQLTPTQARQYLADARTFLTAHPNYPGRSDLIRITQYLEFVDRRIEADGQPTCDHIARTLATAQLDNLYLVLMKETQARFYTDLVPTVDGVAPGPQRVRFTPITTWAVAMPPHGELQRQNLLEVDYVNNAGVIDWEAPESILIRHLNEDLKTIERHDWELVMVDMLQRTYSETRQDPIFRLVILRSILDTAVKGSPALHERYADTLQDLKAIILTEINPFDPNDTFTSGKRREAIRVLQKFPAPDDMASAIKHSRDAASELSAGRTHRWVGWLRYDTDGWNCVSEKPFDSELNGTLRIYAKAGSDHPKFFDIGRIADGKATVTDGSAYLSDGQPVYYYPL